MSSTKIENIINLYNIVFDDKGNVKLCGRENCIKLINLLSELFENIDFGDPITGYMNVENIKKYMNKLK